MVELSDLCKNLRKHDQPNQLTEGTWKIMEVSNFYPNYPT